MSSATVTTQSAPPLAKETRGRRLRAWTKSALRDLVYDGVVALWSVVAFAILVTGVCLTASLIVLIIGIFVWVGFVYVVRWTRAVDRRLAGWQRHEHMRAAYRRPDAPGFVALLKTVSSDPRTWKDLGWLGPTSIVGFALGVVPIALLGFVLAYLSMPIWYWAVSDAHDQYGLTNLGLATVDTLGEAFALAGIGLVLVPIVLLLARGCAAAHSALVAHSVSRSPGAN